MVRGGGRVVRGEWGRESGERGMGERMGREREVDVRGGRRVVRGGGRVVRGEWGRE